MDDELQNKLGGDRISARQIDELIGLARGLAADGDLNKAEVEFLQKWLAANASISDHPVIRTRYSRVNEVLADNVLDDDEKAMLLETLGSFSDRTFELGEVLKSSTLPLCDPAPHLSFEGQTYCFTGTFLFGRRRDCERAVLERVRSAAASPRRRISWSSALTPPTPGSIPPSGTRSSRRPPGVMKGGVFLSCPRSIGRRICSASHSCQRLPT